MVKSTGEIAAMPAPKLAQQAKNTEMNKLWIEAAEEFYRLSGTSLQRGDINSFDDVQKQIESDRKASYGTDAEQRDKWNKAKAAGLQSLKYLKLLVGVASQASSLIPFPQSAATITANALSFVFDIPAAIKGYNDAVNAVFGEVGPTLSQFQIYSNMDHIEQPLIEQIHNVMVSFVKLCAHVVKYRQGTKGARARQQVQSILDDPGLAAELKVFRAALQGQRDVEGTLTLEKVADTQKEMLAVHARLVVFGKIADDTNQAVSAMKDNADRTQMLVQIHGALEVNRAVQYDSNTTQTCINLYAQRVANTGDWIFSHPAYCAWAGSGLDEPEKKAAHVLVLSGPPSSGKSLAAATITKQLEGQKGRAYVAHHFFPAGTHKPDDDKNEKADKYPEQTALKYMAFQLARVDTVVCNALKKKCADDRSAFRQGRDLKGLWQTLQIGAAESGATYTLVMDGLENVKDKQAAALLDLMIGLQEDQGSQRVRVLFTITDAKWDTYCHQSTANKAVVTRLRIQDGNEADMRLFIEDELKDRNLLSSLTTAAQVSARDAILQELPRKAQGSYSRLQFELDEVLRLLSMRCSPGELKRKLQTSAKDDSETVGAAIQGLQRDLEAEEIRELNELLVWVLYAYYELSVKELEAAMLLFSGSTSVVLLRDVIKDKYSTVLKLEDDFVTAQDGVEDYFRDKEKARNSQKNDGDGTISMTIKVSKVDREVCADFLWELAHKAIRYKFDFNAAVQNTQSSISVSEFAAHHTIVTRAFQFLGISTDSSKELETEADADTESETDADEDVSTSIIGLYLVDRLPYHLAKLRELEFEDHSLSPSKKLAIGRSLFGLFHESGVIQSFQKTVFEEICWTAKEMRELQMWMADLAVMPRKVDRQWREQVRNAAFPTDGALQRFAKLVVEGLLRSRSWEPENAAEWIWQFMESSTQRMAASNRASWAMSSTLSSGFSATTEEAMDWTRISIWCQNFLQLSDNKLDALWYIRLGEAALACGGQPAVALAMFECAIDLDASIDSGSGQKWLCYRGMAEACSDMDQKPEALAHAETALEAAESVEADPVPTEDEKTTMRLRAGDYAYEAGEAKDAVRHYESVCAGSSHNTEEVHQAKLGLLRAQLKLGDADALKLTVGEMLQTDDDDVPLVAVLKLVVLEPDGQHMVSQLLAMVEADRTLLTGVVCAMETAAPSVSPPLAGQHDQSESASIAFVDDDEQLADKEARAALLFHRGLAAYKYGVVPVNAGIKVGDEDRTHVAVETALQLWHNSRTLLAQLGGSFAYVVQQDVTTALALHYFEHLRGRGVRDEERYTRALEQLAADEIKRGSYNNRPAGFLAALHTFRRRDAEARKQLEPRIAQALEILEDDILENDRDAFSTLYEAMLACENLRNAAVALALVGPQDRTAEALSFTDEDLEAEAAEHDTVDVEDLRQALDALAEDVLAHVKALAPDTSQQRERIEAAYEYIERLVESMYTEMNESSEAAEVSSQASSGSKTPDSLESQASTPSAAPVALQLVSLRLWNLFKSGICDDVDDNTPWWWTCDGRLPDGQPCTQRSRFSGESMYHCVYCGNCDFCGDCLGRLRAPALSASTCSPLSFVHMTCSASHRWVRLPPMGADMFIGPHAPRVRVPKIRPVDGDPEILEILHRDRDLVDAEEVDVEAWKQELAAIWCKQSEGTD